MSQRFPVLLRGSVNNLKARRNLQLDIIRYEDKRVQRTTKEGKNKYNIPENKYNLYPRREYKFF